MLKEIMTCDGCGKTVENKVYYQIEIVRAEPLEVRRKRLRSVKVRHIRARRRLRMVSLDYCASCFKNLVKIDPKFGGSVDGGLRFG